MTNMKHFLNNKYDITLFILVKTHTQVANENRNG